MPRPLGYCAPWALGVLSDWTDWNGLGVYARGAVSVDLPIWSAIGLVPDSGLFPDPLVALTGRGRGALLAALTAAGLPDPSCGIDSTDRVWVESSVEFDGDPLNANQGAQWGFTSNESAVASPTPGRWRLTADSDWVRGVILAGQAIRLVKSGAPGAGTVYLAQLPVDEQDVPISVRAATDPDADGLLWGSDGLPRAEADATLSVRESSWTIDAMGHVVDCAALGTGLATWTPAGEALRDWLGFTGAEPATITATFGTRRRATYPCSALLCPSRPLDQVRANGRTMGSGMLLEGGGTVSTLRSSHVEWQITGWLDGPVDALGGDLSWHFLRGVVPYLCPGRPVRVYQDWGDSRWAGRLYERAAYSADRTVDVEGYRGAIVGAFSPRATAEWAVDWPERIRRRSPVTMQIAQTRF